MSVLSLQRQLLTALFLLLGISACSTVSGPTVSDFSLSDEPLIGKFVWHDLITDDTDATQRFYSAVLGWTFEQTTRPNGGPYTLAKLNGHYIGGIIQLDDPAGETDYSRWLGYLSVSDVDKAVAITRSAGGTVVVDVEDIINIGKVAAIKDPQGAVLGLIRSIHGDPDDSMPDAVGRIVWNELLTSDDAQAANFYQALAGYEVHSLDRRDGKYTMLKTAGIERAGILQNPFGDTLPAWLTYFAVNDPAGAAAKAESLGGKILLAPSPDIREGSLALVSDPGGAILALQKWPL